MKVALLGFDVEGRSSYEYFKARGDDITVCDQKTDLEVPADATSQLGDHYLDNLDRFDVLVRTAGMHPQTILDKNPNLADKITSQVNEFLRIAPTQNVVGITGTKGKGTTSTLIAKMLEADGKTIHIGGNIGVAPLAMLKDDIGPDDWVVLELSSFQLIDLKYSPHLAVCLMVVPEHLNWHVDMNEYVVAKQQLFGHQTASDIAIYFAGSDNSQKIVSVSPGKHVPYFESPGAFVDNDQIVIDGQTICRTDELKLLGAHNWQNVCAAVTAVWQVTQNVEALRSVLTTFLGLEHRLEFVRELGGVKYYDDSFGTTPETATVAIQAFAEPKIVILGGSDKGASYEELAKVVATGNVRQAVLIGEQATRIEQALKEAGFTAITPGGSTMTEIVQATRRAAQPGDVALLSTGCASFGMFQNYKDRAAQFVAAVNALA